MGLDISHDAFHGAYSAFNRFRQTVAKAIGGSFPFHTPEFLAERAAEGQEINPMWWYWGHGYSQETHPGLYEFFMHSDCDGDIGPVACGRIATELEALLPAIEKLDDGGAGHIEHQGGYVAVTRKFIEGCRKAALAGERLEFH